MTLKRKPVRKMPRATGKKGKARKPNAKNYPKIYSKLFGKKPLTP